MTANPVAAFTAWVDARIQAAVASAVSTALSQPEETQLEHLIGGIVRDAVTGAIQPIGEAIDALPGSIGKAVADLPAEVTASVTKSMQSVFTTLPAEIEQSVTQALSNIHIPGIPNIFGEQQVVLRNVRTGEEQIIREAPAVEAEPQTAPAQCRDCGAHISEPHGPQCPSDPTGDALEPEERFR